MNLYSVRGLVELSIDKDEIEDYLESKKLKNIELPQNSNDIDQGSDSSTAKIGDKNLDKEKRLERAIYIQERDKRIHFGDKQAINEFMIQQTEINQTLQEQKERSRMEYDLNREQEQLEKKLAKITDLDRQEEAEQIQKYEKDREKDINNVYDYFNASEEFWNKWQSDGHKPEESPAGVLITQADNGTWACELHRYQETIPMPDGRLASSAFTIGPIEQHFRHDPESHKQAIIDTINEKYDKLIQDRKEQTLIDPDIKFKRELHKIDKIKTRPGGDYDLLNSGKKISKNEQARIRREEEAEAEKNKKIYGGLY
jgi:hypothetical protein